MRIIHRIDERTPSLAHGARDKDARAIAIDCEEAKEQVHEALRGIKHVAIDREGR